MQLWAQQPAFIIYKANLDVYLPDTVSGVNHNPVDSCESEDANATHILYHIHW